MSEHKIPIPSMLYNAAVGGHVTNSQQIIDENLNKEQSVLNVEQQELNKGILEEKEYALGSNNGMGRVILRKNIVKGVNTLTQNMINKSNTIYVIQYDFTLAEGIIVPDNCVLEFNGGSIRNSNGNSYALRYTTLFISANDTARIFYDVEVAKSDTDSVLNNSYISVDWFKSSKDTVDDEGPSINMAMRATLYNQELRFVFRHYFVKTLGETRMPIDFNLNSATINLTGNNEPFFIHFYSDQSYVESLRHTYFRNGRIKHKNNLNGGSYENLFVIGNSRNAQQGTFDLINTSINNLKVFWVSCTNAVIQSVNGYGTTLNDVEIRHCKVNKCVEFLGGKIGDDEYYTLIARIQNCDFSPSKDNAMYGVYSVTSEIFIENSVIEGFKGSAIRIDRRGSRIHMSHCRLEQNHIDIILPWANFISVEDSVCTDADKFIEAWNDNPQAYIRNCKITNSGGVQLKDGLVPISDVGRVSITSLNNSFSKKSSVIGNFVDIFKDDIIEVLRPNTAQTAVNGDSDGRVYTNIGSCYFDRSLGKPIWWDGTKWIDATGNQV